MKGGESRVRQTRKETKEISMLYFVLWFVITLEPGHYWHIPMENHYATKEACEEDKPALLALIQEQWPEDQALRVYCEPFQKPIKN